MNRVMMGVFHFTPRELRKKRRKVDRLVVDGGLRLRIPCPVEFNFVAVLEFLELRTIPGVESVVDGVYRRVTNTCRLPRCHRGISCRRRYRSGTCRSSFVVHRTARRCSAEPNPFWPGHRYHTGL